ATARAASKPRPLLPPVIAIVFPSSGGTSSAVHGLVPLIVLDPPNLRPSRASRPPAAQDAARKRAGGLDPIDPALAQELSIDDHRVDPGRIGDQAIGAGGEVAHAAERPRADGREVE